jgi:hypothetical protein
MDELHKPPGAEGRTVNGELRTFPGAIMKRKSFAEDIETYTQDIVDTVREPLLMLDATLRVRSANRAFYQTFQVSSEETENRLIYELGNGHGISLP